MPYLVKEFRKEIDLNGDLDSLCNYFSYIHKDEDAVGALNYIICRLVTARLGEAGLKYAKINGLLGAIECAKLEIYRNVAESYEDKKARQNTDVFTEPSSATNLAWAGGFFEGEGCFYASYYKQKENGTKNFRTHATLVQKDKGLLEEFMNVVKCGKIDSGNDKGCYSWFTSKVGEAEKVFNLLRPYLGQRRQERFLYLNEKEHEQTFGKELKLTCKRDHFYTEETTRFRKDKITGKWSRVCKICAKEDAQKQRSIK